MCGGVCLCDFSCEKQSRCTVTKSNGTFDNVCGPKVRGEQFLMIYYCTQSQGGSRGMPLSKYDLSFFFLHLLFLFFIISSSSSSFFSSFKVEVYKEYFLNQGSNF